jgi:hypothetical protein
MEEDASHSYDENDALLLAATALARSDYGALLGDVTFDTDGQTGRQSSVRQRAVRSQRPTRPSSQNRPRIRRIATTGIQQERSIPSVQSSHAQPQQLVQTAQHELQFADPHGQGSSSFAEALDPTDLGIGPGVLGTSLDEGPGGSQPVGAAGQQSRHARAQEDLQDAWEAKRPILFPLLVQRSAAPDKQCMLCMANSAVVRCSDCALVSHATIEMLCLAAAHNASGICRGQALSCVMSVTRRSIHMHISIGGSLSQMGTAGHCLPHASYSQMVLRSFAVSFSRNVPCKRHSCGTLISGHFAELFFPIPPVDGTLCKTCGAETWTVEPDNTRPIKVIMYGMCIACRTGALVHLLVLGQFDD